MKIAVMGAGAIGGYFGGRLAKAGFDVSFIARGAHLDVIRKNGLKVLSPLGDFTIHPATVTDDPAEVGPVDVILFMVKNYDTLRAAEQIRPLVGPDTAIIPFQNGVEARAMLSNVLGARHVLGGVAFIPASIQKPGVIKHNAELAKLVFGEFDKQITPRALSFLDALEKADSRRYQYGAVEQTNVPDQHERHQLHHPATRWSCAVGWRNHCPVYGCDARGCRCCRRARSFLGRGSNCRQHGPGEVLSTQQQDFHVSGLGSRPTPGN